MKLFLAGNVILNGDVADFWHGQTSSRLDAPHKLMSELLAEISSNPTKKQLVQRLSNWNPVTVNELVDSLLAHGALATEATRWGATLQRMRNPTAISLSDDESDALLQEATDAASRSEGVELVTGKPSSLRKLMATRRSTRAFGKASLNEEQLFNLLWSAYGTTVLDSSSGVTRKTVPSGGGLYPLRLYLVLFKRVGDFESGSYRVNYPGPDCVALERIATSPWDYKRCFVDYGAFDTAVGSLMIACDCTIVGRKYGGRAALLSLLEVGHAGQNIYLACESEGLGCTEWGGFVESRVESLEMLTPSESPISTFTFGVPGDSSETLAIEKNIADFSGCEYRPPFEVVVARVAGENDWSTGKSESLLKADEIATTEAIEWHSLVSCEPAKVSRGTLASQENAIDLRSIVSFDEHQFSQTGFPFKQFDSSSETDWVTGSDYLNGGQCQLPIDAVIVGSRGGVKNQFFAPTSSGCAAHPDAEQAIRNATFELVERDAIMITWLNQLARATIAVDTIPVRFRRRIVELESAGMSVVIKDLTLDLVPVVLICARDSTRRVVTLGAGAGLDFTTALERALKEVEVNVAFTLARQTTDEEELVEIADVTDPMSHERLYQNPKYFPKSDVFYGGEVIDMPSTKWSWDQLTEKIVGLGCNLIVCDLGTPSSALSICRVIVPGLVPISFGTHMEALGMSRVYEVPVQLGLLSTCRQLADLERVPHPFR